MYLRDTYLKVTYLRDMNLKCVYRKIEKIVSVKVETTLLGPEICVFEIRQAWSIIFLARKAEHLLSKQSRKCCFKKMFS